MALLLPPAKVSGQEIVINEFMSSNKSTITDSFGDFSDWIELFNPNNHSVNLENYGISDDRSNPRAWLFPDVQIPPNGFLVIFASGRDAVVKDELHTNFKISQTGEPLILTNQHGQIIDIIEPAYVPSDCSYARIPDGTGGMTISEFPTPNYSNRIAPIVTSSHPSGFHKQRFNLELNATSGAYDIHYTLNGDAPTTSSPLYTEPIAICSTKAVTQRLSSIPTTPTSGENQLFDFIWKKPRSVFEHNVIRFATYKDGERYGGIQTKVFFVDPKIEGRYSFPVVSIVTDSLYLFDYESGIYIPGKRFDEEGFNWWPAGNYHNRGREWERGIHITYLSPEGIIAFEADAGMRMRGYGSASMPQKSFNVYFRNEYGTHSIDYPIFKESRTTGYKRLIFRNSGNDFLFTHFRDAFMQQLIAPMNLELQAFRPVVVFINGEYWGIHNVREKHDKYYFNYKLGVDEDSINILDICGSVDEGSNNDYVRLVEYINANDMSLDIHYEHVSSLLDIDNFIDYNIAEIFLANFDWPCNNHKIWKTNQPNSKWRFIIYDLDFSFGYDSNSSFRTKSMEHATSTKSEWPYCPCSNILLRTLLMNDRFRNSFLDRFAYHLKVTFDTNRMDSLIDEFETLFEPEMKEHIDRWGYPVSMDAWRAEIEILREFAKERPCYMSSNLMSFFNLSTYDFDCASNNQNQQGVSAFPNPSDGNFWLFNNTSNRIINGRIIMANSYGRVVYTKNDVNIEANHRFNLTINGLNSGFYILNLISDSNSWQIKVIIQ